jgi:hypothetical protein
MAGSARTSSADTAISANAPEGAATFPSDVRELLGPAPITSFENAAAYERILGKLTEAVVPTDVVEWIWVKDVADLTWETGRARRAKAVRLTLARKYAAETILKADSTKGSIDFDFLIATSQKASAILTGDKAELSKFTESLKRLGLTEESLGDLAYAEALNDVERLQRIIDNANARRDATLREIERRRDVLARRLREALQVSDEVVDAEFENVADPR